ncbi:tyrosine-type recombinase/integrase [Campylobacter sp. CX2-8023-23]|uniref:tyrosine-type recombinase/integrase n=1 Tax=Campylobacter porcelli TaxID=1660073 RepID=UPI002EC32BE6|nr:tyrosine-type recombinase/integrase [Campylobacter sp. CX2-8023-23]
MLNDTKIKSLKPKDKRYKVSDGENLYILVMPSGTKTFIYEFKSKQTLKYKRVSLGKYPIMSLLEARSKRLEFQKMLLNGDEPRNSKTLTTFKEILKKWLDYKRSQVSAKQLQIITRYFERFYIPKFGNKDIKSIKKADIIEATDELNRDGKFETLDRALNNITAFFKWAVTREYLAHNVAFDIDKSSLFKKKAVVNSPGIYTKDEIANLIRNINDYNGDIRVKTAGLLALFTAQRSFNIRFARWDEIDFKKRIWNIPAHKMKMKKAHAVPLSRQVIKLLENYEIYEFKSPYIFPSLRSNTRPISDNAIRSMLRNLGYTNEQLTPHGFRAMFSTIAHENITSHGLSERIIELCLAHAEKNKIKATYNHALNLDDRAKLMQWWADYLDNLR